MSCLKALKQTLAAAILAALTAMAQPASAQVVPLSIEELVAVAEEIVAVRVDSTETQVVMGKIYTTANVAVLENYKGKMAGPQKISWPGGKAGKLVMEVPGVPKLHAGEEAILFLSRPQDRMPKSTRDAMNPESPVNQSYQVVGGFQGKITIANHNKEAKQLRKGTEPIPATATASRGTFTGTNTSAPKVEVAKLRGALRGVAKSQADKAAQKGALRKIAGIRGEFAVPDRTDDPVVRLFDPLPGFAYLPDAELEAVRAKMIDDQLKSQKAAPVAPNATGAAPEEK